MPNRDKQLVQYLDTFWGYGNLDGPYWFVGMEEGGADRWEEVCAHLDRWEERGTPRVAPFRPSEDELPTSRWFGPNPKIQPYWGKICRLVLAAEGGSQSPDEVRSYQAQELAAPAGDTCLLELLPLPSPSTSQWIYAAHSDLGILSDRASYRSALLPRRIAELHTMINSCEPRHVIFVGLSYLECWNQIAGTELPTRPERPVALDNGRTTAVAVRHPSSFGVTSDYFENLGRALTTD